jgi:GDP-L-fucose synthase
MKILITGGTGFIGSNLVKYLNEFNRSKWEIFAPTHTELDLLDFQSCKAYFKEHQFDVVIHTAVPRNYNNGGITVVNIYDKVFRMFSNLFFFTTNSYCINLGSGSDEQDTPLGNIKKEIKYIIGLTHNWVNLRLFGVFGMGEHSARFFPSLFVEQNTITIKNPSSLFSWIAVNDLCFILKWFCRHQPKNNAYDICNCEIQPLSYWGRFLSELTFKKLIRMPNPRIDYVGNNTILLNTMSEISPNGIFTPMKESILNYHHDFLLQEIEHFNRRCSEFKGEDHI